MNDLKATRPGGRSARIQQSVHNTVRNLIETQGRESLNVPLIAQAAGVTPSTIYRRWGDLAQLLSDVALERMQPDAAPVSTGSLRGDLEVWIEGYIEEMTSDVGRTILRDILSSPKIENADACANYMRQQFDIMLERAAERGEEVPSSDALINHLFAPIVYRLLFASSPPNLAFARELIDEMMVTGKSCEPSNS
ncbi:TetR/AcrR family transcriptional regulator [Cohaesibacter haloalkalitolerans]|uniref:TetR/AcrR family transcriptional regulator n=1 Tax=Cohaesibacter haloalkalitolerans TaxID=1162980 RepID=UPI000E6589FF|nr:TetR/AcrR family transcriptional regulator [Cohaesibacter haloalkalitolerans]